MLVNRLYVLIETIVVVGGGVKGVSRSEWRGVRSERLTETREEAVSEMVNEAQAMGANAIVAVRMATSQVMSDDAEVLSYGTAVRLE